MNRLKASSVLHIDLKEKEFTVKSYPDLMPFIGGVGMASKLILDELELDPIIFATGPFNGIFPFASKACCAFIQDDKFVDTYVGGRLSSRLRFCGFDAVVFENTSIMPLSLSITEDGVVFSSSEGLLEAIRGSTVEVQEDEVVVDQYFRFGYAGLAAKLKDKGVLHFSVSSSSDKKIENPEKYERQYYEMLSKVNQMQVEPASFPSCSGCPMGCSKSQIGENGGDVFIHSLVSCVFSENIYSDIPTTFACLSTIGYDYSHEDLERHPSLVYSTINKIYEKIAHSKLETK